MKIANLRLPLVPAGLPEINAPAVIQVPMTALDRRRVRRRLTAPDGAELMLAFPTGTYLAPGTLLERRGDTAYVVSAAGEDVAVIRPVSTAQAVKVAHAVGNLHRDLVEDADGDLTAWLALRDAPLELLLTRLGAPFTREWRPFLGRPSWADE